MRYVQGAKVVLEASFADSVTHIAVDPPDVVLTTLSPGGAVNIFRYSTAGVAKVSPGLYRYVLDTASESGTWHVQFEATGPNAAVRRQIVPVDPRLS